MRLHSAMSTRLSRPAALRGLPRNRLGRAAGSAPGEGGGEAERSPRSLGESTF